MSVGINVKWDRSGIAALETGPLKGALKRALRKAGATALRDMRSEASKRIRARKAIKPRYISRALSLRRVGGDISDMAFALDVSGEPVPLVAYPYRQTKKGVSVEVNRGKRTLVKGSFVATMASGHKGVLQRRGKARLPLRELFGSRPVDALLSPGRSRRRCCARREVVLRDVRARAAVGGREERLATLRCPYPRRRWRGHEAMRSTGRSPAAGLPTARALRRSRAALIRHFARCCACARLRALRSVSRTPHGPRAPVR